MLDSLLSELENIDEDSNKFRALLTTLKPRIQGKRIKQTVIFTRFLDTLHDIRERLQAKFPELLVGTYSGEGGHYYDLQKNQMVGVERDVIKHRFVQGHIDILLCTDAAAEGLNLQTSDLLINYDLPWNPMKVEQRIGRIDRIGQKHRQIYVLNLCFADSAEQFVYERLLNRLASANLVVGTQQFSMIPVTTEEFQKLADGSLTEKQVEQAAMDRAKLQQANNKLMEVPVEEMFNVYLRLSETYRKQQLPIYLNEIWQTLSESEFLKDIGCVLSVCGKYLKINGVETIVDGSAITTDRDLFDSGLADGSPLYFATYGEPVFERLLSFVLNQIEEPACDVIQASEVNIECSAIAFKDHKNRMQLATTMRQVLAAEDANICADESYIQRAKSQVEKCAKDSYRNQSKVNYVEKNNVLQANAHVLLNNQIVRSLISSKLRTSQLDDNATVILKALEEQFSKRDTPVRISNVPKSIAPLLQAGIIEANFPRQGDGYIDAPTLIINTALESLARRVDGSKGGARKQTASSIIDSIEKNPEEIN